MMGELSDLINLVFVCRDWKRQSSTLSEWLNKHQDQPGRDAMKLQMIRVIAAPPAFSRFSPRLLVRCH